MRTRIVESLESVFGTGLVDYLVPTGPTVLLAAILLVLAVMLVRGRRSELTPRIIIGASLTGVLCGLLGARAFHLLQHLPYTLDDPSRLLRLTGGTTSWGGYFLGMLGFCAFLALRRERILPYADLLGSALGLGPLLARWGCFLNGCCFGSPSALPWAVAYPRGGHAHSAHVAARLSTPEAMLSAPVHPVQAYASFAALLLFLAASRFWISYRDRPGATIAFYWLLYAVLRFTTEFFRGDVPRDGRLSLTLSQLICIVVFAGAAWGLWRALAAGRGRDADPNRA